MNRSEYLAYVELSDSADAKANATIHCLNEKYRIKKMRMEYANRSLIKKLIDFLGA